MATLKHPVKLIPSDIEHLAKATATFNPETATPAHAQEIARRALVLAQTCLHATLAEEHEVNALYAATYPVVLLAASKDGRGDNWDGGTR